MKYTYGNLQRKENHLDATDPDKIQVILTETSKVANYL